MPQVFRHEERHAWNFLVIGSYLHGLLVQVGDGDAGSEDGVVRVLGGDCKGRKSGFRFACESKPLLPSYVRRVGYRITNLQV
jgi:hypothetical protein